MSVIQPSFKPLVSILIPTTNENPESLLLALRSAQAQTYDNIEIIISDNSVGSNCQHLLKEPMSLDSRIVYLKKLGGNSIENWLNLLGSARGEYVNFLMDDHLFHPKKIERMLHYFEQYTQIGLVTSFVQLMGADGKALSSPIGTQLLCADDSVIKGRVLGEHILKNSYNYIGGLSAVMIRRMDVGASLGQFCGKQYSELSDIATWLELLHGRHGVYLSDALSYFRLPEENSERNKLSGVRVSLEWLKLLCDGYKYGQYFVDDSGVRNLLAVKISALVQWVADQHEEIREGDFEVESINRVIRQSFQLLLK